MAQRKVTIADSLAGKKIEILTEATTIGQLKQAVKAAGLNVDNKDWLEGYTNTPYINGVSDDAILPTTVTYKGQVTTDLAFLLTNTNKKMNLGMDRKELYAEIKKNNLSDEFKTRYNKHFTNASTAQLQEFVDSFKKEANIESSSKKPAPKTAEKATKESRQESIDYREVYISGVANLLACLSADDLDAAIQKAKDIIKSQPKSIKLSDNDFSALFK